MFAGFLSPKQDPRSLKFEAARVRTILSEKRIAEILYEAFDEILIEGIADARVLLVHVDEPGGHERAHVVGDRGGRQADAVEKSGAGADDHLVECKMLHPELLHEVCGFPGQRRLRLRGGSVEFSLKRRLVGLNDGGAEGKQLLVSLEIDLRRKLRAAVERERDQMPQRLRLGKHLGLLLGDQRKTLPCPAPTAPARSSLRANRALAL